MKIRIKFRKWGVMKFVGHLDTMRYFQKAMRRANIAICYSEGFSPHQIMSFAAPLGVGITSDGEYFDIEVTESLSSKAAIEALNAVMVDGMEIVSYVQLPDNAKTAMAIIAAADYKMYFRHPEKNPYSVAEWKEKIQEAFLSKEEFLITKETKKSTRQVDLKPLVYSFDLVEEEGNPVFTMCLCASSSDNIKPELLLSSFFGALGLPFEEMDFQIHRVEVYTRQEDLSLLALDQMGQEIL